MGAAARRRAGQRIPRSAEPEPEPIAAHADLPEPEPEPVAATEAAPPEAPVEPLAPRTLRPIGDTILHLPQTEQPAPPAESPMLPQAAEDPMAAARRAQLDLLGLDDPGQGSVQAARPNVIPYRSSGAAATRPQPGAVTDAFWDASAREVAGAMSAIGVQSCGQCGLSLSASARFCRRCGTAAGAARLGRQRSAGRLSRRPGEGAGFAGVAFSAELVPPPASPPEDAGVDDALSDGVRFDGVVVAAFEARASFR